MRGFTKAAALLLSTISSASVIPEQSLSGRSIDPVVEYYNSDAVLKFPIATAEGIPEQIFTFQYTVYTEAENACAANDIFINGQHLYLAKNGHHAYGSGDLNFYNSDTQIHASWQITCLSGGVATSEDSRGVHVFSLFINGPGRRTGFTVSFKQLHPRIVQFLPNPTDLPTIEANGIFWRTPSPEFNPEASISEIKDVDIVIEPANSQQKSLQSEFHRFGDYLGKKVAAVKNIAHEALKKCRYHLAPVHEAFDKFSENFHKTFCPLPKGGHELSQYFRGASLVPGDSAIPLGRPVETQGHITPTPTSISAPPSATHTRSLTAPGFDTTNPFIEPSSDIDQRSHNLRTLSLIVFVSALLFWIFKRIRDPRRRVDRAARREERRRRFLYKRAARIQAFRNWFCAFRRTYCSSQQIATSWDEKRTRVIEQEEILEEVMKNNIRALHRTYIENNIEAAEEGRNGYIYEVGSSSRSDRRRSVTTLPGYESEATQPPGYDSDAVSVVNAFRYTPLESEDTPDSSVISTSPRISRDGRDSDFGKENVPDWTLGSRQTVDFRV